MQNANNPPWWTSLRDTIDPARYPGYIEQGALSLRAQVVLEALDTRPGCRLRCAALKFSSRMRVADLLLPELLDAAASVARRPSASCWDRDTGRVGSAGRGSKSRCGTVRSFFRVYEDAQPEPFATPWHADAPMATPRGLASPSNALAALEQAVDEVRQSTVDERVEWGEIHRFRFGDMDLPGDGASGRYGVFRVVTFGTAADGVRVAGHVGADQPLAGFGDAWVLLVHFTRPMYRVVGPGIRTDHRPRVAAQPRPDWAVRESRASARVVH